MDNVKSRDSFPFQSDAVVSQYNRWARVYDRLWQRYVNRTLSVLQKSAALTAGEQVLDLACGTGAFEKRVRATGPTAELVGVDLAPAMLERARSKLDGADGVRFVQADAHDLPFASGSFDVVVCASTFHYFRHPRTVLEEVGRVLRPSGRLVLLDWCRDYWTCWAMDELLRRIDPAHHYCYTLAELRALLDAAGFVIPYDFQYRFDLIWGMMVVGAVPQNP